MPHRKEEIANNLTALAPKPAAEEDKYQNLHQTMRELKMSCCCRTYVCQWKKCGETFTVTFLCL